MKNIKDIAAQAQLSEASYANLKNVTKQGQLKTALQAEGFSQSQAADFVTHWKVANYQPDTASGFSATLFESLDKTGNGTGQYSLAIKGTVGLIDTNLSKAA